MKRTMKEIIQNDTKENNRGFTLVELIVVLVILAILAAILVPALLGYIDRAKASQDLLNAKNLYTAAQTVASEYYAQGKKVDEGNSFNKDVLRLSGLKKEDFSWVVVGFKKDDHNLHAKHTVAAIVYYNAEGDVYYMETGDSWKIDKDDHFVLSDVIDEKYDYVTIFVRDLE